MIRPTVTFKVKGDRAYKDLLKRAQELKKGFVTVGVHEGAGEYASGVSVVEVALWNEFGTETAPERSFIRSTLAGSESLINQWRIELLGKVVDGTMTAAKALEALGFRLRELIKNKINSNIPPPNAESTASSKRAKGLAARTLVETTLLLRSIEFRVKRK